MSARNFDPYDSSVSSCSSSPPISLPHVVQQETDSGCGSDDDPTLTLKINKGLAMGYDYQLIKSVIEQNNSDDMSKFIETMVRTAEVNNNAITSPITKENDGTSSIPQDVYLIDGADLAFSSGNHSFSWRGIEICLKYLHTHGHKKVYVILPYALKHHRYEQNFSESKSLRDLERKNLLVYTNRVFKQTTKSSSYTHISEMLKFTQKYQGYLISNVSLRDVILDFTIYKQIIEENIIRYRLQNEHFQPLLVSIVNDHDGHDCERYFPLCPYGKKCTYGSKCKYFHIERRYQNSILISEKSSREFSGVFNPIKSGPDHLHMYASSLADDARMAYEYGLPSTSISNDFSFVDQRCAPVRTVPYVNRSYSMPQQFDQVANVLRVFPVQKQEDLANRIQSVRHLWNN